MLSDAVIITPEYAEQTNAPASFVLKYAKAAKEGLDAAVALNVYEREMKFY